MMKYLLTLFFTIQSIYSYSQSSANVWSLGIGTGIDFVSFKDISSSPLPYAGFGLPLSILFKYENKRSIHQLNSNLISKGLTNNYTLKSKANTLLLDWSKVNIQYRFLYRIKERSSLIGGSINTMLFYRTYDFLDGESWEFVGSVNIDYVQRFKLFKKHEFSAGLSLPLVGFIHRKPSLTLEEEFLDDFHNNNSILKYGKWKSNFNQWFSVKLNISQEYKISNHLSIIADLGLQFYTIRFPENVTNVNYPFLCHVNYQF